MTEIGCMANYHRKLFDLRVANKSQVAEQALHSTGGLYEVERQAYDMSDEYRGRIHTNFLVPYQLVSEQHTTPDINNLSFDEQRVVLMVCPEEYARLSTRLKAARLRHNTCRNTYSPPHLMAALSLAHGNGGFAKLMDGYAKTDLLILDDRAWRRLSHRNHATCWNC